MIDLELYNNLLLLGSTLVSSLVADVVDMYRKDEALDWGKDPRDASSSERTKWFLRWMLVFSGSFVLLLTCSTGAYAVVRSYATGASPVNVWVAITWWIAREHALEYVVFPIAAAFLSFFLSSDRWLKLKVTLAVITALAMVAAPALIDFGPSRGLEVRDEIMTELRTATVPFEARLSDPEHFREMCDAGYVEEDDREDASSDPSGGGSSNSSERTYYDNPQTLREYMANVEYWREAGEDANTREALSLAYQFYLDHGERDDLNAVGRMWFYKGQYESWEHYRTAGEVFSGDGESFNAGVSYENLFYSSEEADDASEAMRQYVLAVDDDDSAARALRYFKDVLVKAYPLGSWEWDSLADMCRLAPKDAFLNAVHVSARVAAGDANDDDLARVRDLIADKRFASCPKLVLLRRWLGGEVEQPSIDDLYSLRNTHPDWFESEDCVNLAWFVYSGGEYVRAYEVAREEGDVLLCAEAYLQDEGAFPEMDAEGLYQRLAETVMGGKASTDRAALVVTVLAGDLGLASPTKGLAEACERAFEGSDSALAPFVIASLSEQEGDYMRCLAMCNEALGRTAAPDPLYNRIVFLKADALVTAAAAATDVDERRADLEEAERILLAVKDAMDNDYMACLQRLSGIYKEMDDREQELQEVSDLMVAMR